MVGWIRDDEHSNQKALCLAFGSVLSWGSAKPYWLGAGPTRCQTQLMDIEHLLHPPTATAQLAHEVSERWSTPALHNHSVRSWVWAKTLGESIGLAFDEELLYVAALLHDLGVTETFDSHTVPFETAGGAVAAVFAAGAGWSPERRERVQQIIERHMWVSVDPEADAEGYLLEMATSLDVSAASPEKWDADLLRAVTAAVPRLDFSEGFAASIHSQATRKPASAAARLDGSGRIARGAEAWLEL